MGSVIIFWNNFCDFKKALLILQISPHVAPIAPSVLPARSNIDSLNDFEKTDRSFSGTGSGEVAVYRHKATGEEYVVKSSWIEAYAGAFYSLILGKNTATIIPIQKEDTILAGSKYEAWYVDLYKHICEDKNPFPEDPEVLAKILVACAIFCEQDLKALDSSANLGVVGQDDKSYFLIDHAQSFYFENAQKVEDILSSLSHLVYHEQIKEYFRKQGFHHIVRAINEIALIPLEEFKKIADFYEDLLAKQPKGFNKEHVWPSDQVDYKAIWPIVEQRILKLKEVAEAFNKTQSLPQVPQEIEQFFRLLAEYQDIIDPQFVSKSLQDFAKNPHEVIERCLDELASDNVNLVWVKKGEGTPFHRPRDSEQLALKNRCSNL